MYKDNITEFHKHGAPQGTRDDIEDVLGVANLLLPCLHCYNRRY
jgi:hypothetical protein